MGQVDEMRSGPYAVRQILPKETWGLRAMVLWPEKSPGPECRMKVDEDPDVLHFGVFFDKTLVSVGTFMPQPHRNLPPTISFRLRAMATHPNHRGQGCGRALIRHAEAHLAQRGEGGIWADARKVALGFYAGLGWDVSGTFYEVPKRG
ncbi:MAG: hypothetical protein CMC97_05680, partial [Flavobacteriales bacterium]|nr:hypothetical protein [Flavobacteriales bacterium]